MSVKERISVPTRTRRELLVECGHQCSVPFCFEKHTIEFHHINGDPSDNKKSNLIVLCRNHHAMADRGVIDRKECESYKARLRQISNLQPRTETLKEKVEREGISVQPEQPIVGLILHLGRRYMNWRYGKPDASIKREILILSSLIPLCFVPLFYVTLVLKSQLSTNWLYFSIFSALAGAILLSVLSVVMNRRCPECKGYFGIETIDSKLVDEEEVYQTETEIRLKRIYRNTYRCVFCGHTDVRNEPEYETIETDS